MRITKKTKNDVFYNALKCALSNLIDKRNGGESI